MRWDESMTIITRHDHYINSNNYYQPKYPPLKPLWRKFLHLLMLIIGWFIYFYLLYDVTTNSTQYLLKYCCYLAIAFPFILASSFIKFPVINNKPSYAKPAINDNINRDHYLNESKAKEANRIIIKINDAGKKICFYS